MPPKTNGVGYGNKVTSKMTNNTNNKAENFNLKKRLNKISLFNAIDDPKMLTAIKNASASCSVMF